MPPEVNVAIFEQNPNYVRTYRLALEASHHKVVAVATTMEGYDRLLPKLGDLGVEVVLVDESLRSRNGIGFVYGDTVAREVKSFFPDIKTVGIPLVGEVIGADENVSKMRMLGKQIDIGKVVTSL